MRGPRMTVRSILKLLASGMTLEEVLAYYAYLEREDLLAALAYGAATCRAVSRWVAPGR